jgi:hypothetical protein
VQGRPNIGKEKRKAIILEPTIGTNAENLIANFVSA